MKQYLELAKAVKEKGTYKAPAREGMPGTTSLFGYQFRHDLSKGFPLLTTKKLSFKNIVTELLWFLRGDTNIKYLVDNGCNIWNEDAYSYYVKLCDRVGLPTDDLWSFAEFEAALKNQATRLVILPPGYILGDCGKQYGWLWRNWEAITDDGLGNSYPLGEKNCGYIDQIKDLIDGLKKTPLGRRNIITAWNPTRLNDMALNACHALVQFNCRPLGLKERNDWSKEFIGKGFQNGWLSTKELDECNVPQYKLDCQMYQRSADLFLGVPYNIASYALLTHILCKICNMVPGDFIHTFGDVHIYDNHIDQIDEQLSREPKKLPDLKLTNDIDWQNYDLDKIWNWGIQLFELKDYNPHPAIKGKLSTGL